MILKAYNYFTFCNYYFFKNKRKEKGSLLKFSISISCSLFLYFNFLTLYGFLQLATNFYPSRLKTEFALLILLVIWSFNFFVYLPKKIYLDYNFRLDKNGIFKVIIYIFITIASFIMVSNLNRKKVFDYRENTHSTIKESVPNSLEENIKKWIDKF